MAEVAGATGTQFWNDFYGSILGNGIGSAGPDGSSNSALQDYNTAAIKPVWATQAQTDYKASLKAKNDAAIASAKPVAKEVYADPVDQFLHDKLGFSKPGGRAELDPETGAVTNNPWGVDINSVIRDLVDNFGAPLVAILVAGGLVWYGTAKALKV